MPLNLLVFVVFAVDYIERKSFWLASFFSWRSHLSCTIDILPRCSWPRFPFLICPDWRCGDKPQTRATLKPRNHSERVKMIFGWHSNTHRQHPPAQSLICNCWKWINYSPLFSLSVFHLSVSRRALAAPTNTKKDEMDYKSLIEIRRCSALNSALMAFVIICLYVVYLCSYVCVTWFFWAKHSTPNRMRAKRTIQLGAKELKKWKAHCNYGLQQ